MPTVDDSVEALAAIRVVEFDAVVLDIRKRPIGMKTILPEKLIFMLHIAGLIHEGVS